MKIIFKEFSVFLDVVPTIGNFVTKNSISDDCVSCFVPGSVPDDSTGRPGTQLKLRVQPRCKGGPSTEEDVMLLRIPCGITSILYIVVSTWSVHCTATTIFDGMPGGDSTTPDQYTTINSVSYPVYGCQGPTISHRRRSGDPTDPSSAWVIAEDRSL